MSRWASALMVAGAVVLVGCGGGGDEQEASVSERPDDAAPTTTEVVTTTTESSSEEPGSTGGDEEVPAAFASAGPGDPEVAAGLPVDASIQGRYEGELGVSGPTGVDLPAGVWLIGSPLEDGTFFIRGTADLLLDGCDAITTLGLAPTDRCANGAAVRFDGFFPIGVGAADTTLAVAPAGEEGTGAEVSVAATVRIEHRDGAFDLVATIGQVTIEARFSATAPQPRATVVVEGPFQAFAIDGDSFVLASGDQIRRVGPDLSTDWTSDHPLAAVDTIAVVGEHLVVAEEGRIGIFTAGEGDLLGLIEEPLLGAAMVDDVPILVTLRDNLIQGFRLPDLTPAWRYDWPTNSIGALLVEGQVWTRNDHGAADIAFDALDGRQLGSPFYGSSLDVSQAGSRVAHESSPGSITIFDAAAGAVAQVLDTDLAPLTDELTVTWVRGFGPFAVAADTTWLTYGVNAEEGRRDWIITFDTDGTQTGFQDACDVADFTETRGGLFYGGVRIAAQGSLPTAAATTGCEVARDSELRAAVAHPIQGLLGLAGGDLTWIRYGPEIVSVPERPDG